MTLCAGIEEVVEIVQQIWEPEDFDKYLREQKDIIRAKKCAFNAPLKTL